jgi:hypothetical protein
MIPCYLQKLSALIASIALLCAGCDGGSQDANNTPDGNDTAVQTDSGDTVAPDTSSPDDGSTADTSVDTGADDVSDTGEDGSTDAPTVPARFDFCQSEAAGETHEASPDDYRATLDAMSPGDVLKLAPGTYDRGLPIHDLNGSEGNCFVIEGPKTGEPAIFTGSSSRNTVSILDSSYC